MHCSPHGSPDGSGAPVVSSNNINIGASTDDAQPLPIVTEATQPTQLTQTQPQTIAPPPPPPPATIPHARPSHTAPTIPPSSHVTSNVNTNLNAIILI